MVVGVVWVCVGGYMGGRVCDVRCVVEESKRLELRVRVGLEYF